MILIEQVKMSNPSLLVISVRGKIVHKAPVSSIYEPGRSSWKWNYQHRKNRITLYSSEHLRKNHALRHNFCPHVSALRLSIIFSHLYTHHTYTFISHYFTA